MRSHVSLKALSLPLALLAALSATASAEAQSTAPAPQIALNRFEPSFAGDRMFGVPSPFSAGSPGVHVAVLGDYAHNPLVLRREGEGGNVGAVVSSQLVLHLDATVSLWNRLSINLDVPVALLQDGQSPTLAGQTFSSPGAAQLGDLRAGVRVRLYGEYHDPIQVAVGGYLWFPTGPRDSYMSDKTVRGLPMAILGGRALERLVYSVAIGPEIRPAHDILNTASGTSLRWGAGLGVLLGEARHLQLAAEYSGSFVFRAAGTRGFNGELLGSVRYRVTDDLELGAGAGPGLAPGIGTPDFRGVLMIAYTPEQKKAPEDRDKDGILDPLDACPDEPGLPSADPKKNGCPPPPDRDGDGIPDAEDACPDVKGVPDPDPKKNGCPPDKDGDGIIDAEDACPDVKGVRSEDPKKNGCPPDRDGDGIIDAEDACPDVKGVADPDPKKNGCPPDTDADGIPDAEDACPTRPGKPDPDPKKNGCPVVYETQDKIEILEQVQFKTASDVILPASDDLLSKVAQILKAHPEFTKILVEGHTDNRGGAMYNKGLSARRAASVKRWLVKHGIAANRLESKGFGEDVPIGDNATEDGRQKNRRVEFKIVGKAGAAPAKAPPPPPKAPPPKPAKAPKKK